MITYQPQVSTRVSTQVSTLVSTHFISRFELPLSDPATYIITPNTTYVAGIPPIQGTSSEAGWPGDEERLTEAKTCRDSETDRIGGWPAETG